MKKIIDYLNSIGKKNPSENVNEPEQEENKATEQEAGKESAEKKGNSKAHIYNLIIVDESGSMHHLRQATLSGINETIGTIRSAQEEFADTQEHLLTLVLFDSGSNRPNVRTIFDCRPISEIGEFNDYKPNGCTPLYDAMGESLTKLRERIKGNDDASAVVTVLTDGLENDSRKWNASQLRRLIEQLKEEGWSFSYMGSAHNVKEVSDLLSIENVVEFSHDQTGAENTWNRERSSRKAYYGKMHHLYRLGHLSKEEKNSRKRQFAEEFYGDRITPDFINELKENEIFVFGSNQQGLHQGGAAAFAMSNFGAVWGQGEGLQGQSYAIPTMEGIDNLKAAVDRFTKFADEHPELHFFVTKIGCGIAGYPVYEIAPLFKKCIALENVALPIEFWEILGLKLL